MKKLFLAVAVAVAAFSTTVYAQDLKLDRTGMYVGGSVGTTMDSDGRSLAGVVLGYQVHKNLRVEGTLDYNVREGQNGTAVVVNAVPQYRIPGSVVTPYALVGVGYGLKAFGDDGDAKPVYNLGAGVRVGLSDRWEFDGRYRHLNTFNRDFADNQTHLFTAGLNYRF